MGILELAGVLVLVAGLGSRARYLHRAICESAAEDTQRRQRTRRALTIGVVVGPFSAAAVSVPDGAAHVIGVMAVTVCWLVASLDVDRVRDWLPDYAGGLLLAAACTGLVLSA
ncbi:MAG TPA: hypothetical protein VFZ89_01290 [Solirubrobacteraceae bacterium]